MVTTTREGWQVERKLLPYERDMICSSSKTFGTQRIANHEPSVECDSQEPIGGSIISTLDIPNNLGNNIGDLSHDVQVVSEETLVGGGFHVAVDSPTSGVGNQARFTTGNIEL